MARCGKGSFRATAGTRCCVEVNVMRNCRGRMVGEVHFYGIAFTHTNHLTRDVAAECPIFIFDAISHGHDFFDGLHFYNYFGRIVAVNWRRCFGSMGHYGIDNRQFAGRSFSGSLSVGSGCNCFSRSCGAFSRFLGGLLSAGGQGKY